MVLSRIFGKRELKEGQLTKREKQEALRLNPGMFDSLDRAIDIYRKAPILPESVMKRKEKFESIKKEKEATEKKRREQERKTFRFRIIKEIRDKEIAAQPETNSTEYGSDVVVLGSKENVSHFVDNVTKRMAEKNKGVKRNSSIRNGSVRNGSVRNGSIRNGSIRNGSIRNGSIRKNSSFKITAKGINKRKTRKHKK